MNLKASACPNDDTIAAFAAARLEPTERSEVQSHLDSCPSCHELLRELARIDPLDVTATGTWADRAELAGGAEAATMRPGERLDGYVLRRRLDAGAMGEVWVADDPELHREVAVKVLHGTPDKSDPLRVGLLRREARSLAQLSHPNVVTVYAVSEWQGREYIAMEYVAGVTLRQWLQAGRLTLAERLDTMIQAGRGLAAAHRAGIIHRDFKPSNVLVGADGRVRVGDFGLARLRRSDAAGGVPGEVTPHTTIAGTPVYMAPEQLRGGAATEAGDQYSFAVSLYEAVHGLRPFAGSKADELIASIERDTPQLPAQRVRVPGWLRAILLRGLSAEPARRFPSVEALVDALVAGRRRSRRVLVAAAMVAVAVVSLAAAIPIARKSLSAPSCASEAELIGKVWSPTRAEAIRRQFDKVAGQFGIEQWNRAAPLFHDYAKRWSAMRVETCEATRVRHVQSDSLFDRRLYCLDRRLAQLDSMAGALAGVEKPGLVVRAMDIAAGLPSLDPCADTRWLSDAPLPALASRPAVDEAFKALDAGKALSLQGQYKQAMAAFKALEPRARELDHLPLTAELVFEIAWMADRLGEFELAEAEYLRAAELGAKLGRTDRVFEAQLRLMRMEAYLRRYDRALGRASSLASLALLSTDPLHVAMQHENLGAVYGWQGKYAESNQEYRLALSLLPAGPTPSPREASTREGLGLSLMQAGDYNAAEPELLRALELRVARFGPKHPWVANTQTNLGNLAYHRGDYKRAREHWERALEIQESISGVDPELALYVGNVAIGQQAAGDFEAALASFDRAIALRRQFLGPLHFEVALALANKGGLLGQMGRFTEGEALLRQALALREEGGQKLDHPDFVRTNLNLGSLLVARAASTRGAESIAASTAALEPLDRGIALGEKALGPKHQLFAQCLLYRARARLALGRLAAAHADAERGLAIMRETYKDDAYKTQAAVAVLAEVLLREGHAAQAVALLEPMVARDHIDDFDSARAAWMLVRAWWETGKKDDALALAPRVMDAFAAVPDVEAKARAAEVRAWAAKPSRLR